MRIIHFCLSNFYIDGFSYQENELVAQNVKDGHDVTVVASTETFGPDKRLTYLEAGEYRGTDGAKVIRLPYRRILPHAVMRKLRIHPSVFSLLMELRPDVILFHGTCGWELNTVARFVKQNSPVKLFVDSHEDFNNSARTWASKWLLHFLFYRPILLRNLYLIEKILCVNKAAISFVSEFYGVPSSKLEFFPLGGTVLGQDEYEAVRIETRNKYGIDPHQIVFVQSGKFDRSKKLLESLRAFSRLRDSRCSFFIVGHLSDDIVSEVHALLQQDSRIHNLGWKRPDELRALLCAADVYVQPGTQSATMQMSLCCRCAVILDDVPSHVPFIMDNGWLVGGSLSIDDSFRMALEDVDRLPLMSKNSGDLAARLLDYRSLAARLYR